MPCILHDKDPGLNIPVHYQHSVLPGVCSVSAQAKNQDMENGQDVYIMLWRTLASTSSFEE